MGPTSVLIEVGFLCWAAWKNKKRGPLIKTVFLVASVKRGINNDVKKSYHGSEKN
jgi:hypothetical protein